MMVEAFSACQHMSVRVHVCDSTVSYGMFMTDEPASTTCNDKHNEAQKLKTNALQRRQR